MVPGVRSRRPSPLATCPSATAGPSMTTTRWPRSLPPRPKQPDAFTLQISRSGGSRRQKHPRISCSQPRLAACPAGFLRSGAPACLDRRYGQWAAASGEPRSVRFSGVRRSAQLDPIMRPHGTLDCPDPPFVIPIGSGSIGCGLRPFAGTRSGDRVAPTPDLLLHRPSISAPSCQGARTPRRSLPFWCSTSADAVPSGASSKVICASTTR
jgi:hypothetical protein